MFLQINLIFTFISTDSFVYLDLQMKFSLFNEDKIRGQTLRGKLSLSIHCMAGNAAAGYPAHTQPWVQSTGLPTLNKNNNTKHQKTWPVFFWVKILKPTDQLWNLQSVLICTFEYRSQSRSFVNMRHWDIF